MRSSRAATFLRKGSGLRRYRGAGSPPKTFKRSRSQGNCAASATGSAVNGNKVQVSSFYHLLISIVWRIIQYILSNRNLVQK